MAQCGDSPAPHECNQGKTGSSQEHGPPPLRQQSPKDPPQQQRALCSQVTVGLSIVTLIINGRRT